MYMYDDTYSTTNTEMHIYVSDYNSFNELANLHQNNPDVCLQKMEGH